MVALAPLALILSLSVAISAVPLGTARVKPTTTDVWSLVPTTSIASKTSTSTTYSATSTAAKSPDCPAVKPYYLESTKSCSCSPDDLYAEYCSVDKFGTIVATSCSYGYTNGATKIFCQRCVNGGYNLYAVAYSFHVKAPECEGLGYVTPAPPVKYVTPLVPSNYTPPPTTKPTSTFSVRGRTSTVKSSPTSV